MGATRLTIAPEVRHKVGLPSTDMTVTDAKVYKDINAGLRKMAADFDWPWLIVESTFSLGVGDSTEALAAAVVKILWVAIEDIPLKLVQRRRLQTYINMTGFPRFYSVFAGNIRLFPEATTAQTVTYAYVRGETLLDDDTDQVLCPDTMIDIVYTYAAIETATRLKDAVLRAALKEELRDWKARAADNVKLSKDTYAPNVGRTW